MVKCKHVTRAISVESRDCDIHLHDRSQGSGRPELYVTTLTSVNGKEKESAVSKGDFRRDKRIWNKSLLLYY